MDFFKVCLLISIVILLPGCAQTVNRLPSEEGTSMLDTPSSDVDNLSFETRSSTDQVKFVLDDDISFIEVHSPTGIGSTRVIVNSGQFNGPLGVRLYLAGLENLTLVYDEVIQTLSVSSGDPELITRSVQVGSGSNQDVSQDSPYWMDVQQEIHPVNQEPYFSVSLPAALFQSGAAEFELSWVDFYR